MPKELRCGTGTEDADANLTCSNSSLAVPAFRHTSRRQWYELELELAHGGRLFSKSRSHSVQGSCSAEPESLTLS